MSAWRRTKETTPATADRHVDVVVVGGGATGVGVARDAAMRGLSVVLLERADLAQGTSGRFHGLLHSGARYVVSDPLSATECAAENTIISRIHSAAVEQTGGLFVVTPDDDLAYSDSFLTAARATGVSVEEISVSEALHDEPRLNPGLTRAFRVHDAAVDGWQMVWGAARSAQAYGAQILTYHEVADIIVESDHSSGQQTDCSPRSTASVTPSRRVVAVHARGLKTGQDLTISCRMVVNAAGPWAGRVAALAGSRCLDMAAGRGVMIAMNHRVVHHVINRCIPPGDGDILVPDHTVSIIGTTDCRAEDPDRLPIPRAEVAQMLAAGDVLVPGLSRLRALHAWAGARPLVRDTSVSCDDTRHMSRGMVVVRHATAEGLGGMVSVAGGKLTTYRLMAERAVDVVCDELNHQVPCRTAEEAVPGSTDHSPYRLTHRLAGREAKRRDDPTICECELVGRAALTDLMDQQPDASFDDLRRHLRIAMGPCQGGFCAPRVAGLHVCCGGVCAADASERLRTFLRHRWNGLWSILYGEQVREAALDFWMLQGTLALEDLPRATPPAAVATPIDGVEDGVVAPDDVADVWDILLTAPRVDEHTGSLLGDCSGQRNSGESGSVSQRQDAAVLTESDCGAGGGV